MHLSSMKPFVGWMARGLTTRILLLLLLSGTWTAAEAFTIYNRTDRTDVSFHKGSYLEASIFTGLPTAGIPIFPLGAYPCPSVVDSCTGEANDISAANASVSITIRVGSAFSCSLEVLGDGWVELVEKDRSTLNGNPGAAPQPDSFICESFANVSPANCPFGIPPILFGRDGCVGAPNPSLWPNRDSSTDPNASFPYDLIQYRPYTAPQQPRNVKFLATGDPQYIRGDNTIGNSSADLTLAQMKLDLLLEPQLRGVLILGDLTQNGESREFQRYREFIRGPFSSYFYEGLGNHDRPCVGSGCTTGGGGWGAATTGALGPLGPPVCLGPIHVPGTAIPEIFHFVFDHTLAVIDMPSDKPCLGISRQAFFPRNIPKSELAPPHYSWDWHDIHFVQLNVFPGDGIDPGTPDDLWIDPMNSLSFLETDLDNRAPVIDGQGKPVVLLHHYPPNIYPPDFNLNFGNLGNGWSASARQEYWNAIRDHNVIAIIVGHWHLSQDSTRGSWESSWTQPAGALSRPFPFEDKIPVYNVAAAKGSGDAIDGVYSEFEISCDNKLTVVRKNVFGGIINNVSSTPVEFCSPLPGSCTGTTYQNRCPDEVTFARKFSAGVFPQESEAAEAALSEQLVPCGPLPVPPPPVVSCDPLQSDGKIFSTCSVGSHSCGRVNFRTTFTDSDGDTISDLIEESACTDPNLRDTDKDGLDDGIEDSNFDGIHDSNETDACKADSDGDGINDGVEDANHNGRVDAGETDPRKSDTDSDADGIADLDDNCVLIPNGPLKPDTGGNSQLDTNGDGYGNLCDADLDNNDKVDFADLAFLKSKFFTSDPDADLNGDGRVDFADLAALKSMFFNPPGPSGLVVPTSRCVSIINVNQNVSGSWTSSCVATHIDGSYARYYTFILSGSQEMTIGLQSSIDTYLFLLDGPGENGSVIAEDDDGGQGTNSEIIQFLSAGTYTIEATTFDAEASGDFDLSVH